MTLSRRVATLAALTLASAGLVGVAGQPASAADDATFTWSFSDYLARNSGGVGFTSHVASGGATNSGDTDVVFSGGEGTGSLESGNLHLAYDGTVTYSWHADITFSNPEVIVEGGDGKIVADVAWAVPTTGSANDVVLTTFDPATAVLDGDSFSATPRWATAGSSWAPELLTALPDSVDAYFKATGSTNDARKAPALFTSGAGAEASAPAVTVETSYDGKAALIDVDGTGFTAVTNPGDAGVYVALAEAGDFPETDDFEDQEKVADAEWVTPAQMADGTFSVTLNPESRYLNPSKQYAVYTWQAHAHSNPSQDTETAVEIIWSNLASPATLGAKVAKLPTPKKPGSLKVTVAGADSPAAGKVTVVLTKKGQKAKNLIGKVVDGAGTVKLPKLVKGAWKAKVQFLPSTAAYSSATKTLTLKVK